MWDQLPDEIVEKIICMAAEMYETERQGPTDLDGQLAALFYDAVYVPCVNFAFENEYSVGYANIVHHMVTRSRSRIPELPRDNWERILKYKTEAFQRGLDDEWHQEMMGSWLGELEWRDWLKHG